ncbi:MAG: hypothetical protein CL878_11300 [Dehalococcoidia bacterium]|nr:hypothetical protein [Dehalococcoidia bacterium]
MNLILFVALGFVAGGLNGLLGIGGGILLIPLLVYIGGLGIHLAAGVTAAQGVVSGATGALVHGRRTPIDVPVGLVIGLIGILAATTTALFSERIPSLVLTLFYLTMVVGALVLVLLPQAKDGEHQEQLRGLARWLWCVVIGVVGGILTGLVGAGAGFVAVPLMLRLLVMPVRVVIGTSLVIILIASGASAVGKALTGQVPLVETLAVMGGSLVGAHTGSRLSHRTSPQLLHRLLVVVLSLILVRVLWDVVPLPWT